MRFLLDVNVGRTIAGALAAAGYDVALVIHSDPRAVDQHILERAAEEDRILITYDRDFSALIFADRAILPPAVIYIRFTPINVADVVPRLLPLLDLEQLRGHMTVIDERRTRSTPFPTGSNDNG